MKTYKLGTELRCQISGFVGVAVAMEEHYYGCTTYSLMPRGCEDVRKVHRVSVSYVEKVGRGVVDKLAHITRESVNFKCGDLIETVMGVRGTVTLVQHTMHGRVRYFAQAESEDGKSELFVCIDPTMRLVRAGKPAPAPVKEKQGRLAGFLKSPL